MPDGRDCFGRLFKQIYTLFEVNFIRSTKQKQVTPAQMDILFFLLSRKDQEVTQKDIETALRLSNPTVTGLLNRMEEKGLIRRVKKEQDKRYRMIQMTDQSRDYMAYLRYARQKGEENMVRGMTPEQVETLRSLLKMVLKNLTEEEKP